MSDRLILNLPSVGPGIIIPTVEHDWSDCFGINKYGRNPSIDAGTPEDIWSYGGMRTYIATTATLFISSSSLSDTIAITIHGLDADGNRQTAQATLTGQTKAEVVGYTWSRIYRAWNATGTALVGDVYIFEDDTLSSGVPTTATKVRGKIDIGKEQTHMTMATVPAGYTGYLLQWYSSLNRANTAGSADIELFAREPGGVFRSKDIRGLVAAGSSEKRHDYKIFPEYPPLTDLKITANVTGNGNDISAGYSLLCVKNK